MRTLSITLLAVHVWVVLALPGLRYEPMCQAKPDACYKAVLHGHLGDRKVYEDAKSDCASFFRTTITPCPTTITHTSTNTHIAKAKTVTKCKTVVSTDLEKVTDDVTSFRTTLASTAVPVLETDTMVTTATDISTVTTFTTTVVVDVTSTVTVTSTTTVATVDYVFPTEVKRDLPPYGAPACHPTTSIPNMIPKYAECRGRVSAYSSACSCLDAAHSTKTLPRHTVAKSTTVTKTITPTVTKTVTKTIAGPTKVQTITDTTVVPTTVIITITSTSTTFVTVTQRVTDITTVAQPTTSTVVVATVTTTTVAIATATHCPIKGVTGPGAGQYLTVDFSIGNFVYWTTDQSEALEFYIDPQSQLLKIDGGALALVLAQIGAGGASLVALQGGPFQPGNDFTSLTCSNDATNGISCVQTGGSPNNVWMSNSEDTNPQYLLFGDPSDLPSIEYEQISIAFVCSNPEV